MPGDRGWAAPVRGGGAACWEVEAGALFTMAHAVVCAWWESSVAWEQERVWPARLEKLVGAAAGQGSWAWWRVVGRNSVIFPEVVEVAGALVDPVMRELVWGDITTTRPQHAGGGFAQALGERLGRPWLGEWAEQQSTGPLLRWMVMVVRQRRGVSQGDRWEREMWRVRLGHRPPVVSAQLWELVQEPVRAAVVPRRTWEGTKAASWRRFEAGLEHTEAYARQYGHLAVQHHRRPGGFDLGLWLANRRGASVGLSAREAELLTALDPWWNPPWPISWQRACYRMRAHSQVHGLPCAEDAFADGPTWLERWLRRQLAVYEELHPDQRRLLAEAGLGPANVAAFARRPGRRALFATGLACAASYAAQYGHLAVSIPTVHDGFELGRWLNNQRTRQRATGRPTRGGLRLSRIDLWWNPPWPLGWQRASAARAHREGLPEGTVWWPRALDVEQARRWLTQQQAAQRSLHPGQQELLATLTERPNGITSAPEPAGITR